MNTTAHSSNPATANRFKLPRMAGFTLIELMVAIVIISILASIALPLYGDYVIRSRITEATGILANKRARMELFFDNNHTYVGAPECTSDTTSAQSFTFDCAAAGATTYVLEAVGSGTMSGFTFTIDQANAKATTSAGSGWTANATCWIRGREGSC
ncbi:MAG: prepilin-type N-terminal cleavage/methylation domain-containing protein [Gammaproteobacteria bacterium]|nr:prepilin-type N-terminal cleavage/methylation domain-containing protein [Gammaproteobacteria bacterium]MBU1415084.1 prepilin-type N-terminal cleavage/methylation domain-containing protein [Gammaproteobacteria bacterium]